MCIAHWLEKKATQTKTRHITPRQDKEDTQYTDQTNRTGFNPGGAQGGKCPPPPQGFQLPPQAYDTINNPSPALPNLPPQVCTIILILPPQGHMSRLNAAGHRFHPPFKNKTNLTPSMNSTCRQGTIVNE